jgi:hypothetical protein
MAESSVPPSRILEEARGRASSSIQRYCPPIPSRKGVWPVAFFFYSKTILRISAFFNSQYIHWLVADKPFIFQLLFYAPPSGNLFVGEKRGSARDA